jgi:transcriptional regulator with XRE-family HTH domain
MSSSANQPIFCRRLKEARKAAGLSQKKLGIEAGLDEFVASTRINRYEVGVHDVDLGTATRLARALGVPLAYLYAEDDKLARLIRVLALMSQEQQRALLETAEAIQTSRS